MPQKTQAKQKLALDHSERRIVAGLNLIDARFVPPLGCKLLGMTHLNGRLHELMIAPSSDGRFYVAVGEPSAKPNKTLWTGTNSPVDPDLLSRAIARCAPSIDWSRAT